MKRTTLAPFALAWTLSGSALAQTATPATPYVFERGYPTTETIQRAYDDADLNRAV